MSLMSFNKKKKPPVEAVVVYALFFMAEHWFGKLLPTVNSSVVVSVQTCAGMFSKPEKEGKKPENTLKSFYL